MNGLHTTQTTSTVYSEEQNKAKLAVEERSGTNGTELLQSQSPSPTTIFIPEHFLNGTPPIVETPKPRRFHGSVQINPVLMAKDAGVVMEEVVKHLTGIVGAKVNITLEIEATIPDGMHDSAVRTILENCSALKFKNPAFEEE